MKITMIGTGYVGLVTGACFAEVGHYVTCIDINSHKIDLLKQGILPFYEPGLEAFIQRNTQDQRLIFADDYTTIDPECSIFFVAVPTPSLEGGGCNLDYVLEAVDSICQNTQGPITIVIKSTTPAGTITRLENLVFEQFDQLRQIDFVSNPEFLKEGSALADCMKPDRIILGSHSKQALERLRSLYAPFTINHDRVIEMDPTSSEMTKYASNAMLATRISFMNELANTCEKVGANIHAVRIGMGADARIGYHFLYAGIGWGGSCFPKDIRALIDLSHTHESPCTILEAVYNVNQHQKTVLVKKINHYFDHDLKGKLIALWGLSFKPDTDDIREAPSLDIIEGLIGLGASLKAYDPLCMNAIKTLFPTIEICQDPYTAAQGAECVVLITEWKQFRSIDLKKVKQSMKGSGFFDGRNQFNPQIVESFGFDYMGIGQGRLKVCADSLV